MLRQPWSSGENRHSQNSPESQARSEQTRSTEWKRDKLYEVFDAWDTETHGEMLLTDFRAFADPYWRNWDPTVYNSAFTEYQPSHRPNAISRFEFVTHLMARFPSDSANFMSCIRGMQQSISKRKPRPVDLNKVSTSEIVQIVRDNFRRADVNKDKVLTPEELTQMLTHSPQLNLSAAVIEKVVADADINHDGLIDYEEFMPTFLSLLHKASNEGMPEVIGLPEVWDMTTEEIIISFQKIFDMGSHSAEGFEGQRVLYPDEFADLLSRSNFNFTQEHIEKIVEEADLNHDGVIVFDEFMPALLRAMREHFADEHGDNAAEEEKSGADLYKEYAAAAKKGGRAC